MNKKKILLGSIVLATAGLLASTANSKFSAAKPYAKTTNGGCKALNNATAAAGGRWTTTGSNQAQIQTKNCGWKLLYANSTCTQAIYFKF